MYSPGTTNVSATFPNIFKYILAHETILLNNINIIQLSMFNYNIYQL